MLLCLAAYPALQPVPDFSRYFYVLPSSIHNTQLPNNRASEIFNIFDHHSHQTNADEERLEHGLNGEVLPDPLPISSRPIDSCTVNEYRRKIICTCPNAIVVILCILLSTLESLLLCYPIRASLNRHGGSGDRIATCARGSAEPRLQSGDPTRGKRKEGFVSERPHKTGQPT